MSFRECDIGIGFTKFVYEHLLSVQKHSHTFFVIFNLKSIMACQSPSYRARHVGQCAARTTEPRRNTTLISENVIYCIYFTYVSTNKVTSHQIAIQFNSTTYITYNA